MKILSSILVIFFAIRYLIGVFYSYISKKDVKRGLPHAVHCYTVYKEMEWDRRKTFVFILIINALVHIGYFIFSNLK